jgi:hypothetical protein
MNNTLTPETDHIENQLGSAAKFSHPVIWRHARQLERERDEAREQSAKLRDIAERAINFGEYRAPYLGYPGPTWEKFRSELNQLKECAK